MGNGKSKPTRKQAELIDEDIAVLCTVEAENTKDCHEDKPQGDHEPLGEEERKPLGEEEETSKGQEEENPNDKKEQGKEFENKEVKENSLSFPRTKIYYLDQLQRADHICFWRLPIPIWHHGIVLQVNVEDNKVLMRHYSGTASGFIETNSKIKASVVEEWINVNCTFDSVYRVDYPLELCFTNDEVIENTQNRLGEDQYNALTNNCEHFARSCKIGEKRSLQIEDMKRGFSSFLFQSGSKVVKTVGQDSIELLMKNALKQGGKRLAVKVSAEVTGAIVIAVIEVYEFAKNVYSTWQQYKNGNLDFKEFWKVVASELGKCSMSTFCAIGGDILGQFLIPIPVLGGIVGGLLGLIVGKCIGPIVGRIFAFLSK